MNARVQYVISADDKTKSAIASVRRNFDQMQRDVGRASRGINSALSVVAGVGLVQGFKAILRATAETEQGARSFGKALNEVRDAARELVAAKSGLPEAAARMGELRDILRDPGVVAAADAFTSALVVGFSKVATQVAASVGGIRQIAVLMGADPVTRQERIDDLDRRIESARDELKRMGDLQFSSMTGDVVLMPGLSDATERAKELREQIAELERAQQRLIDYTGPSGGPRRRFSRSTAMGQGINAAVAARQAQRQAADAVRTSTGQTIGDIQREIYADLDAETRRDMERVMDEINREGERGLDELHGRWEKWKEATGRTIGDLSPYAETAARNAQSAFADFLFDPFETGIKGMLKGFVDILRRMVAEAAAAKIFEALGFGQNRGGGGGGLLGGLGSILGTITGIGGPIKIPGRAMGGPVTAGAPYMVGELGPELFVPGRSGTIVPNGRMGGGVVIAPTYNIDARGATSELINALPEILKRRDASLREDIIEGLRRGRY